MARRRDVRPAAGVVLDRAGGRARALVVVNDAGEHAAARVHLPWGDLAGRSWRLEDQLAGDVFERDGDELANEGLFVQLPPWGTHLLTWTAA